MTPEMVKIRPAVRHRAVPHGIPACGAITRYTKDKKRSTGRNMWLFFRRARLGTRIRSRNYFELHPEYWGLRLLGRVGLEAKMEALREMILAEDRLFLDAFRAVNSCPQVHLAGEMYKRPKFPDAKPEIIRTG